MNKPTLPRDIALRDVEAFSPPRSPARRKWSKHLAHAPAGEHCLLDPLAAAQSVSSLLDAGRQSGFTVELSSDFEALCRARRVLRGDEVSPMFDPEVSLLDEDRAFWLSAHASCGSVIALQAFRLDIVHPNLAEWALGWMAGLYLKRKELVLPRRIDPPANSVSQRLSGKLVYHGELWIDRHFRDRTCLEVFPRLGMLLAYLKWQPRSLWALVSEGMATRGHMVRMGYGQIEPGFLTWEWEPNGADPSEWIALAENSQMEFLIAEMQPGS